MKYLKASGALLLCAVPCVLLVWGAVAMAQSRRVAAEAPENTLAGQPRGAVAGTTTGAPAAVGATTVETRIVRQTPGASFGGTMVGYGRRAMVMEDPLKDLTDPSQATIDQLREGDQYLEFQTRRLAQQYADAKDDEARDKARGELAETIERHFDVRHLIRKQEVDELEARVKSLREHLQRRKDARQTIVQTRLNQFISTADGLGWDADSGQSRPGGNPYSADPFSSSYGPSPAYGTSSRTRPSQVAQPANEPRSVSETPSPR